MTVASSFSSIRSFHVRSPTVPDPELDIGLDMIRVRSIGSESVHFDNVLPMCTEPTVLSIYELCAYKHLFRHIFPRYLKLQIR